MSDEKRVVRGWGWPALSKKAHYFEDGRSLCNRWMYMGQLEDNNLDSPDDCATCRKRLAKVKGGAA